MLFTYSLFESVSYILRDDDGVEEALSVKKLLPYSSSMLCNL